MKNMVTKLKKINKISKIKKLIIHLGFRESPTPRNPLSWARPINAITGPLIYTRQVNASINRSP